MLNTKRFLPHMLLLAFWASMSCGVRQLAATAST
jgi:hypothetical protein